MVRSAFTPSAADRPTARMVVPSRTMSTPSMTSAVQVNNRCVAEHHHGDLRSARDCPSGWRPPRRARAGPPRPRFRGERGHARPCPEKAPAVPQKNPGLRLCVNSSSPAKRVSFSRYGFPSHGQKSRRSRTRCTRRPGGRPARRHEGKEAVLRDADNVLARLGHTSTHVRHSVLHPRQRLASVAAASAAPAPMDPWCGRARLAGPAGPPRADPTPGRRSAFPRADGVNRAPRGCNCLDDGCRTARGVTTRKTPVSAVSCVVGAGARRAGGAGQAQRRERWRSPRRHRPP